MRPATGNRHPQGARLHAVARVNAVLAGRKVSIACLVVVTAAILGLSVYYSWPVDRSIFVSARTQSIAIRPSTPFEWVFSDVALCMAGGPPPPTRPAIAGSAAQTADADSVRDLSCGPATPVSSGPATLVTSAGSELELRRIGLGPLELRSDTGGVQLLFDGDVVSLTPEAGVVVDSLSFANGPALPFRGTAAIGVPVGAQGGAALLDGTYELREALGTRQRPELVGSGTLQAGDAVAIVEGLRSDATPRADVKGFLAPVDADQAGFRAVVSAFRPAAKEDGLRLEIARHGFAPTEIAPSWKDRVLADAFTYALVAIATVGLTGLTLLSQLRDLLRRPPGVAKNETAGTGNDALASRMIGARGTATTGSQPEPAMTTASPHETPADWQSVRAGDAGPADTPKVMPADPSATVPRKAGEQTASTGDVSVPAHQPRPRSENA